MSSIKLKHSGGNAVSLHPPTSAPSSSDVQFKLPTADGSNGQVLQTDGSGNLSWVTLPTPGITEADQWRVTADFTMNSQYAATITSNWERNDTTFDKIGTGMSVDGNGHFTFPSTGIWLIQVHWTGARSSGSTHWGIHYAYGMTDGVQSNGFEIMKSYVGNSANNGRNTAFMQAMFDVQNTSGYKVLFGYYDNMVQTTVYKGSSSTNENSYTFIKLGET